MRTVDSPHWRTVLQALLVTFLWSSSWVLIKIGLRDLPPLPFAGLRYALAFLCLLPLALRARPRKQLRRLAAGQWLRLALLGLLFYAVTQGAQFLSLVYLPAVTTSLLLSFTSILVALLGIALLGERPTPFQWAATALYLAGVGVYFYPVSLPRGEVIGLAVAGVGMLANALSSILGRHVNRSGALDPMAVTVVSMGIGAAALLGGGVAVQGLPRLTPVHWAIVVWLAVVNSALAFTLWNHTLRTLSAMESSLINNTMLFQIAVLAWAFLNEPLSWRRSRAWSWPCSALWACSSGACPEGPGRPCLAPCPKERGAPGPATAPEHSQYTTSRGGCQVPPSADATPGRPVPVGQGPGVDHAGMALCGAWCSVVLGRRVSGATPTKRDRIWHSDRDPKACGMHTPRLARPSACGILVLLQEVMGIVPPDWAPVGDLPVDPARSG